MGAQKLARKNFIPRETNCQHQLLQRISDSPRCTRWNQFGLWSSRNGDSYRVQSVSHLGQSCRSGRTIRKIFVIWQTTRFEIALSNCQFSDDNFLNLLIISRDLQYLRPDPKPSIHIKQRRKMQFVSF